MLFYYKAINNNGNEVSDYIDAPSEIAAKQKIKKSGLYLTFIQNEEIKKTTNEKSNLRGIIDREFLRIRKILAKKQVALFSRQLSTLLKAGMPLMAALNAIIEQIDDKIFKNVIIDIKEKIEEGLSLSNAMEQHSELFSEMYINMIKVGENLGSLDDIISRLAEMEEKKEILKNKIRAALWYPIFMIILSAVIVGYLLIEIIPKISEIFSSGSRELPLPTKIVIGISNFLVDFWILIPLFLICLYYFYRRYSATTQERKKLDEIVMKLPLIKNLYNKNIVYRFTYNLGILLTNRVDLLKSLEVVKKIVNNMVIEEKIEGAIKIIKEGGSISQALKKHDFMPKLVIGMITAGEVSDKVDEMLLNIGNVYENEIDMVIKSLTSIIEPLIIIIMGVMIGTIVISVMLPIMEMNLMVQ
jgi:general secretion pathway protein F